MVYIIKKTTVIYRSVQKKLQETHLQAAQFPHEAHPLPDNYYENKKATEMVKQLANPFAESRHLDTQYTTWCVNLGA